MIIRMRTRMLTTIIIQGRIFKILLKMEVLLLIVKEKTRVKKVVTAIIVIITM